MIRVVVTGGAGFIGANFILDWFAQSDEEIINLDSLTYAGNLVSLEAIMKNKNFKFVKGDITDRRFIILLFENEKFPFAEIAYTKKQ